MYKIKCEVTGNGKLKNTQHLNIRENVKNYHENIPSQMTSNISTWCCLSKGTSSIKV